MMEAMKLVHLSFQFGSEIEFNSEKSRVSITTNMLSSILYSHGQPNWNANVVFPNYASTEGTHSM